MQLHNRNQVATLEMEVERLQARPAVELAALVWKDPLMQEVDGFIAKAATARSPILIRGEPGRHRVRDRADPGVGQPPQRLVQLSRRPKSEEAIGC